MNLNEFLEIKKFAGKIRIKKLPSYAYCKENEKLIERYNLKFDASDEITLQNTKAYIMSIKNKEKIDEIYSEIEANPYISEVLDFVTLNKVIEHEILDHISEIPHFYDPDLIIIPVFDHKLNFDFIYDYLRTNINWEKNLWKNELVEKKNPIDRYGHFFYHFTDFIYINHIGDIYYYYLEETGRIYIFNNITREFISDFPVFDEKSFKNHSPISINELIEIVEYYCNEKYQELMDYYRDHNMISEKNYNKVIRRVK